jgi:hypothetical protein
MRKTMTKRALPVLLALLALGCNSDPRGTHLTVGQQNPPLGLENGLFFVGDSQLEEDRALTIDLAGAKPKLIENALPSTPIASLARPGREGREVLVLTGGRAARDVQGKREAALNSHLLVFDHERELLRHALLGRYARVALSDDGRFAVAFQPTGSVVLQNAIEVVDLDKVASDPTALSTVVNLQFDGRAPTNMIFSPASGFARRILVVPFANAIQLLDLEHPELGEISVPLKTPENTLTLQPQEVLFSGDQIFVRSSNSSQVLALALLPDATSKHGFQPAPSLLSASSTAIGDIAVTGTGEKLRLLALAGALTIFDANKGSATVIEAARGFSQILPFEGRSPVDSNVLPRALIYSPVQSQVGFLDLGSDSAWATRTVETVELGQPLSGLVPLSTRKLALGIHSGAQVSVIDLEQRTVAPIALSETLIAILLDETALRARLWLLTDAGTLAVVDLTTLATSEVPIKFEAGRSSLDNRPPSTSDGSSLSDPLTTLRGRLLLVPGAQRRIAVLHDSDLGHVTLIDADNPTREGALALTGFFLDGLFD